MVVTSLSGGWQHNYSTKIKQAGYANEHHINSLQFVVECFFTK